MFRTFWIAAIALVIAGPGSAQTSAPPVLAAGVPSLKFQPNGTLLVPVSDKSGRKTEPMVLTPLTVQARSAPPTTTTPDDAGAGH
jgi:hypothetical protein